jgi:hypothetical protein
MKEVLFMLVVCENCREKVDLSEFLSLEGYCPNCNKRVELCSWCEHLVLIDENDEDTDLCLNCFHESYEPCQDCGEYYSRGDLIDGLCEVCHWESEENEEEED